MDRFLCVNKSFAKADALEALDASISTLKYLREKEEDINLQIEAAVAFSGQHGVVAESEFATRHRHRVAPRRIDDTPENAVQFGLQAFYRKEFLQVLDAQIQLLQDNWKVAFKIIEPAVTLLKFDRVVSKQCKAGSGLPGS